MSITRSAVLMLGLFVPCLASFADGADGNYGLGRAATPAELADAEVDVRFDGLGLPPGAGTAAEGARLYRQQCAGCHGRDLEGNSALRVKPLLGDSRNSVERLPYAPPLFAYIRRSMPLLEPGSLSNDETYALVAYLLTEANVIADEHTVIDAESLSGIDMPNRERFFEDDGSRLLTEPSASRPR